MTPELSSACFRLQQDINNSRMILLVCRCGIEYWGRSRSIVGSGDRVVLIKPDSTLIVHSLSGFKPLNWMSPPADTVAEVENDVLRIYSQRTSKPYEEMKIKVEEVHDYRSYDGLEDKKKIELTHTERDMQDYIAKNPHLIADGFQVKSTEYRSPLGLFDIYGKAGGKYAVVELKSERAGLPAALQLKRYRDWLQSHLRGEVDGILMSPSITPNALVLLRKEKLIYRKPPLRQIKRPVSSGGKTLEEWCHG